MKELLLFCFLMARAHAMNPPAPVNNTQNQPNHWRLFGLAMGDHQILVVHALRMDDIESESERLPAQRRLDALIARTDALMTIQGSQLWLHMRDSDEENCDDCCIHICIEPQPEGCLQLLTNFFRSGN